MTAEQQDQKSHWESVYAGRPESGLSWHQDDPARSLRLIQDVAPERTSRIIDAGAGRSRLAERLIEAGYRSLTVVDLSETALAELRARLQERAACVRFVAGDLLEIGGLGSFDLWHDRAVFHFLRTAQDRARYLDLVRRSLRPGAHLILATFAPDGPEACSGLPVCRYDADALAETVGSSFSLLRSDREIHETPWGTVQPFTYGVFRYCSTGEPGAQ